MDKTGIKKLAPGRWQIRVTATDPKTGKRRNTSRIIEAPTIKEAQKARVLLGDELLGSSGKTSRPPRLAAYCATWIELRRPRLSPSTYRRYKQLILQLCKARIGDIYVDQLEPPDVKEYLDGLAAKGLGGSSCHAALRLLRTVTRDMQADFHLPHWACERVSNPLPLPRYSAKEPNLLSAEELRRVLESARVDDATPRNGPRTLPLYPLVFAMATTGLRFCEASALRWEDIEGDSILVRRSAYRGDVQDKTKTGVDRRAPLDPAVSACLEEWRAKLMKMQHPGFAAGWVFPDPRAASPLEYDGGLARRWQRIVRAAGVPHRVTLHGLRRTLNNLARQVASGDVVRAITGHQTAEMTHHYSHVDHAEKAQAVARVLQLVGGVK